MKYTFTKGVIDRGQWYEAGQSYDLSDEVAKRINESVGAGTAVAGGSSVEAAPVQTEPVKPVETEPVKQPEDKKSPVMPQPNVQG